MYTLYIDKQEIFECNIEIDGASTRDSKARLIIESPDVNLIYYGTLLSSGECKIPVNRLKNHLKEGDKGNIKLEVIAEDTYFEPWIDTYTAKLDKKVSVTEVKKPKVAVAEIKNSNFIIEDSANDTVKESVSQEPSNVDIGFALFKKLLFKYKITNLNEITKNKKKVQKISEHVMKQIDLNKEEAVKLIQKIITNYPI